MADRIALALADGLRVVWDRAAAASLAQEPQAEPGWTLEGSVPDGARLRVLTAATAGGGILLLAGLQPAGSKTHDQEQVAALILAPDGTETAVEESLITTEFAADGAVRRLGLELYRPGAEYPLRAAGDATEGAQGTTVRLAFRIDGDSGTAVHELVEG